MATALLLALLAGAAVGAVLGLVGGGGSILAVPLLVYGVGMQSPHAAIGTASVAVALNALVGLAGHARAGRVKWPCAAVFAASGVLGAALGAQAGQALDGERLLALFGGLMVVVGLAMLRPRKGEADAGVRLNRGTARTLLPRLAIGGGLVGLASGFFGIGGGFLIVPALLAATAMPLPYAIGTSLVAVAAFGATTALSYAAAGLVDWPITAMMLAGGAAGSAAGMALGTRLASRKGALEKGFAALVIAVGGTIAAGAL